MVWIYYPFLQCSNMLDMAIAKTGAECCIKIHYLRTYKPMDQHNELFWWGKWITGSTVSLPVRNLGTFEWFYSFQRLSHLPTSHIPHDHFDRHGCWHIDRFFAACWNTHMSVSTLEMCLLCDDQYFKLQYFDIIFLLFWKILRWQCMWCCGIP